MTATRPSQPKWESVDFDGTLQSLTIPAGTFYRMRDSDRLTFVPAPQQSPHLWPGQQSQQNMPYGPAGSPRYNFGGGDCG